MFFKTLILSQYGYFSFGHFQVLLFILLTAPLVPDCL